MSPLTAPVVIVRGPLGAVHPRPSTSAVTLTHDGRTLTVSQWADEPASKALGLTRETIYNRIHGGWDHGRILTTPLARRSRRTVRPETSIVDDDADWLSDYGARAFVVHHPDGATLEEVGIALGLVRERVRQIESKALEKLRRASERLGIDGAEMLAHLRERDEEADVLSARPSQPPLIRRAPEAVPAAAPTDDELDEDGRAESPEGTALDAAIARLLLASDRLWAIARELPDVDRRPLTPTPHEEPMPAPKMITHDGITDSINGWSKRVGMSGHTIAKRLGAGASPAEALSTQRDRCGLPSRAAKSSPTAALRAAAEVTPVASVPSPDRAKPYKTVASTEFAASTPVPVTALDGVALLAACGVPHEVLGRAPKGRLVLLLEEVTG